MQVKSFCNFISYHLITFNKNNIGDNLHSQQWAFTYLLHSELLRQPLPWQFCSFTYEINAQILCQN